MADDQPAPQGKRTEPQLARRLAECRDRDQIRQLQKLGKRNAAQRKQIAEWEAAQLQAKAERRAAEQAAEQAAEEKAE